MELVAKESVYSVIDAYYKKQGENERACACIDIWAAIKALPAADAVPVQHWIRVCERLPDPDKWVLCRCEGLSGPFIEQRKYSPYILDEDEEKIFDEWWFDYEERLYAGTVIEWKELD